MQTSTRSRNADYISREELRNLLGREEADKYFAQKNHYVMLGKTKLPTKDDVEAARRMWTGTSGERSRDFARANTLSRWYLASLEADRRRHLKFLDVVDKMLDANEPITLEALAEKFRGTHIRTAGSAAQQAARRANLAKGREVRASKRKGKR